MPWRKKSTLTKILLSIMVHVVRFDTLLQKCWNPFWWFKKPTQLKHCQIWSSSQRSNLHIKHGPSDLGNDLYKKNKKTTTSYMRNFNSHAFWNKKRNRDIPLISTGQCSTWHSNWQLVLACTNSFLISDNAFVSDSCNVPRWFVSFSTSSQIKNVWTFTILLCQKRKTF